MHFKPTIMRRKIENRTLGFSLVITIMLFSSSLMANINFDEEDLRSEAVDTVEVLTIAEVMPEIEGGIQELYKKIKYPRAAQMNNVEGRVFIRFIVDENGEVQEPEILKDIGAGCGEAALEGIKQLKFTPGTQNGQPVSVYYTLPVTFKLQN